MRIPEVNKIILKFGVLESECSLAFLLLFPILDLSGMAHWREHFHSTRVAWVLIVDSVSEVG